jgi:hypothetical protein
MTAGISDFAVASARCGDSAIGRSIYLAMHGERCGDLIQAKIRNAFNR